MKIFLAILLSLGIVAAVSGVLGAIGLLAGINFWITFLVASALQLIIGACWNTWIDAKTRLQIQSIQASNRLANSLQMAELTCAYCGTKNTAEIFVSKENSFDCVNCSSNNKIQVALSTTRVTEPIVKDKVLSEIFQKMQSAPDAVNTNPIVDDKIEISGGKTNE